MTRIYVAQVNSSAAQKTSVCNLLTMYGVEFSDRDIATYHPAVIIVLIDNEILVHDLRLNLIYEIVLADIHYVLEALDSSSMEFMDVVGMRKINLRR
jgi:hypothetical protein